MRTYVLFFNSRCADNDEHADQWVLGTFDGGYRRHDVLDGEIADPQYFDTLAEAEVALQRLIDAEST